MSTHPSLLQALIEARDAAKAEAETLVRAAKAEGRATLSEAESRKFEELVEARKGLDEHIADVAPNAARYAGDTELLERLGKSAAGRSARHQAPLQFPEADLKRAYEALSRGETARLESRDFNTAESLLPPALWPFPVGLVHEARLASFLPAATMTAPSMEYIVHTGTTGSPAVVAEGASKPELVYSAEKQTATAAKIAAHTGLSYEIMSDFPNFASYVNGELTKEIIQTENNALINGDGTGAIVGFLATPDILSYAKGTIGGDTETSLDAIEIGIAGLRTGTSLAEPDLLVLNPLTWSGIRREKDTLGRYLVSPDPTVDEPDRVWGLQVLVTTQIAGGTGLMLCNGGSLTSQVAGQVSWGNLLVREALSMRIGWSGTDFVQNILRSVAEERIQLAVERPTAIMQITGLPTGLPGGGS